MKSFFLILTACMLALLSCKKEAYDNGCIEELTVAQDAHGISSAEVAIVAKLFTDNNLDITRFRYYSYRHDTQITWFDRKIVKAEQYINGLRVFNGDIVISFVNDKVDYIGGDMIARPSLHKPQHFVLPQVRRLFINDLEKDRFLANQNYRDSCLQAEFGYYYMNKTLVKAWRVTPKSLELPQGVYEDRKGKRLYYTNGIISLF